MNPKFRQWQQSWLGQTLAATIGAGGFAAFTCFAASGKFSKECLVTGAIAAGAYFFGIAQHSPDSASFNPDGSKNLTVEAAAAVAKVTPTNTSRAYFGDKTQ